VLSHGFVVLVPVQVQERVGPQPGDTGSIRGIVHACGSGVVVGAGTLQSRKWLATSFVPEAARTFNPFWSLPAALPPGHAFVPDTPRSRNPLHLCNFKPMADPDTLRLSTVPVKLAPMPAPHFAEGP